MGFEDQVNGFDIVPQNSGTSIDHIEDREVRRLLIGIIPERLTALELRFQEMTQGDFSLLNREVTDRPEIFTAIRDLGYATTNADQNEALDKLVELVNNEGGQMAA